MAQWDITVDAGSGVGSGSTNDQAITEPGDFDGATINSVTILGTPTATTDGATDDTISVNFYVSTDAAVDVYGTNTVAGALATFTFGDSVSAPQNIVVGASTSPAPTTAVAADWDQMRMRVIYSANKMGDNETVSWSSFQVRVDYTPPGGTVNEVTITGANNYAAVTDLSEPERDRYREAQENIETEYGLPTLRQSVITLKNAIELTDTISALTFAAPVVKSDDITATDSFETLRKRFRESSENVSLDYPADTLRKHLVDVLNNIAFVTDSIVVTSGPLPTVNVVTKTDNIDVNDAEVILRQRFRELISTAEITDNLNALRNRFRELAEAITAEDSLNGQVSKAPVIVTDAIDAIDNLLSVIERNRLTTDSIAVEDVNAINRLRDRQDLDTIDINDDAVEQRRRNRAASDSITVPDSNEQLRQRFRTLTDNIIVVDNLIAQVSGAIRVTLTDTVDVIDSLLQRMQLRRDLTDSADITDSAFPSAIRARSTADSITFNEVSNFILNRGRLFTDNAELTDNIVVTIVREGEIINEITLSDQIDVTDLATITYIENLVQFFVKHGVEKLSVSQGIDQYDILHSVERNT